MTKPPKKSRKPKPLVVDSAESAIMEHVLEPLSEIQADLGVIMVDLAALKLELDGLALKVDALYNHRVCAFCTQTQAPLPTPNYEFVPLGRMAEVYCPPVAHLLWLEAPPGAAPAEPAVLLRHASSSDPRSER